MRGVRGEVEYLLALLHLHSVHCHVYKNVRLYTMLSRAEGRACHGW